MFVGVNQFDWLHHEIDKERLDERTAQADGLLNSIEVVLNDVVEQLLDKGRVNVWNRLEPLLKDY